MLTHPTLQQLRALKLDGMAQAFQEQLELPNLRELSFEERLGLLVDREHNTRDNRSFDRRLNKARLKQQATLEDLDTRHPRNLDAALVRSLATGARLQGHHNLIITGPTGVSKTFLACALAQRLTPPTMLRLVACYRNSRSPSLTGATFGCSLIWPEPTC